MNSLVCFGKIVDKLDKFVLVDEVFPALRQVPCKEPATLMAILGGLTLSIILSMLVDIFY